MKLNNFSTSRIKLIFFLTAFVIGLLHTWLLKDFIDTDGISHIDMGDGFFHGNLNSIINGFWSPFYAFIIGFVFYIVKPSPEWELTVVHFINFFIYLITFFSFDFFLRQLTSFYKQPLWLSFAYSLFIWSSMNLIMLSQITPDMLVTVFVYLASGILLKIKSGITSRVTFILLGLILGFSYLAKTPMLFMSFVFIGVGLLLIRGLKTKLVYLLLVFISFSLIAGPYIYFLSKSKGRFSYGDIGIINYNWHTNLNVCRFYLKDYPGCSGKLINPPRVIYSDPTVIEYSTPLNVTYPIVYDASYWNEGYTPYFDLKGQIIAFLKNAKEYFNLFFKLQGFLLVAYLMLFSVSKGKWLDIKGQWVLLVPALAAMFMYFIVHVEFRYIGAFIVLFWLGLFSALKLSDSNSLVKILIGFMIVTSFISEDLLENRMIAKELRVNWEIADALKEIGIKEGDKVGVFGVYDEGYWARLGKIRIIAEIPHEEEIKNFWAADSYTKSQVLNAFKKSGAKMVIDGRAPTYSTKAGWKNLKRTSYYYYVFSLQNEK